MVSGERTSWNSAVAFGFPGFLSGCLTLARCLHAALMLSASALLPTPRMA